MKTGMRNMNRLKGAANYRGRQKSRGMKVGKGLFLQKHQVGGGKVQEPYKLK